MTEHRGGMHEPQELIETLERHRDAAAALVELARNQRHAVERGSPEALLQILSQRQLIIDRFVADQTAVSEACRSVQESKEVSNEQREAIRTLVAEIDRHFEIVLAHDSEDEARLQQDRQRVQQELQDTETARIARRAYLKGGSQGSRFADERG